jgi:hypothetical protein
MKAEQQGPEVCYLIRERTIRGSRERVLSEIDELVTSLLAVRRLVVQQDAGGQRSVTRAEAVTSPVSGS